jgi:predicted dehydrogenase
VLFDLGTHAHQLARFITGLEVTEVAAEMSQIVAGRDGARGVAFVESAMRSFAAGGAWTAVEGI